MTDHEAAGWWTRIGGLGQLFVSMGVFVALLYGTLFVVEIFTDDPPERERPVYTACDQLLDVSEEANRDGLIDSVERDEIDKLSAKCLADDTTNT